MGGNTSIPAVQKYIFQESDPCEEQMKNYLKCVESHTKGLSEGDECMEEVNLYKNCRAQQKSTKS